MSCKLLVELWLAPQPSLACAQAHEPENFHLVIHVTTPGEATSEIGRITRRVNVGSTSIMSASDSRPELIINYSPQLDLCIAFAEAVGYGGAARPDYRFEMHGCWRHPTGTFAYSADNLYFGLDGFERFAAELQGLQQGLTQEAALKDPGEMVVLRLERKSNTLLATFDIREFVPPLTAKLHVGLEVDYDLFVNKLKREVDRFVAELREIQPPR